MLDIQNLRREYRFKSLDLADLNPDPFKQFCTWFEEARQAQVAELNAMSFATSSLEGRPSCRTLLLKGIDARGFIFFTHYESRKGREMAHYPFGCMVFYWTELERQVIVEGGVERISRQESEDYFASRPRGSQLGTWASQQDQVIPSRKVLEDAYHRFEQQYENGPVPKPTGWGGYRLLPDRFEFWQGRSNRLHDRFSYVRMDGAWQVNRLAP